jgi:hypothetical protein
VTKQSIEQIVAEIEAGAHVVEDVTEVDTAEKILFADTGDTGETARIVIGTLLRIGEHRIGGGDLLEAILGAGLLVAVGMVLQRELAEGILDRLLIGVARDA